MKKTTEKLLDILKNTSTVEEYIEKEQINLVEKNISECFNRIIKEKNITVSQIVKQSDMDRTYTYQILNGSKKPSRDKVLALCFGLQMTFEETQTLLKETGYPYLYAKIKRDSIIIFALQHGAGIQEVNEMLFSFSLETLL